MATVRYVLPSLVSCKSDELGGTDELDGTTELLLGATLDELGIEEEELGRAEELDGITELLPGTTLDELGMAEEELASAQLCVSGSYIVVPPHLS